MDFIFKFLTGGNRVVYKELALFYFGCINYYNIPVEWRTQVANRRAGCVGNNDIWLAGKESLDLRVLRSPEIKIVHNYLYVDANPNAAYNTLLFLIKMLFSCKFYR
jgi:hypothetical protein